MEWKASEIGLIWRFKMQSISLLLYWRSQVYSCWYSSQPMWMFAFGTYPNTFEIN